MGDTKSTGTQITYLIQNLIAQLQIYVHFSSSFKLMNLEEIKLNKILMI